jgi:hypothetical protein
MNIARHSENRVIERGEQVIIIFEDGTKEGIEKITITGKYFGDRQHRKRKNGVTV